MQGNGIMGTRGTRRLSDYTYGKGLVKDWADHWREFAEAPTVGAQPLARFVDYQQVVRAAFTSVHIPDIIGTRMPQKVEVVHILIRKMSSLHQLRVYMWHLGLPDQILKYFGPGVREPRVLIPIYEKIGRNYSGEKDNLAEIRACSH